MGLLLMMAAIATVIVNMKLTHSEEAKTNALLEHIRVTQARAEAEQTNAQLQASLTFARNRQDEHLKLTQKAAKALEELLNKSSQIATDLAEIQSNSTGRVIASQPGSCFSSATLVGRRSPESSGKVGSRRKS